MKLTHLALAALTSMCPGVAFADGALTRFDVAEDLSRFVYSDAPVFEDRTPAYGNAFVTQGYVYPAGTLDGGVEGTMPDGRPAFPDKVIGTWTCDGYFVGDGMRTTAGVLVISRQVIAFEDGDLLITQGPELAQPDVAIARAVTGGTGAYASAPPAIHQTLLGMTDGYGVRLQLAFDQDALNEAKNDLGGSDEAPGG